MSNARNLNNSPVCFCGNCLADVLEPNTESTSLAGSRELEEPGLPNFFRRSCCSLKYFSLSVGRPWAWPLGPKFCLTPALVCELLCIKILSSLHINIFIYSFVSKVYLKYLSFYGNVVWLILHITFHWQAPYKQDKIWYANLINKNAGKKLKILHEVLLTVIQGMVVRWRSANRSHSHSWHL